jgi:hypothetical protein
MLVNVNSITSFSSLPFKNFYILRYTFCLIILYCYFNTYLAQSQLMRNILFEILTLIWNNLRQLNLYLIQKYYSLATNGNLLLL